MTFIYNKSLYQKNIVIYINYISSISSKKNKNSYNKILYLYKIIKNKYKISSNTK